MSEPKKEAADPYKFFTGITGDDWRKVEQIQSEHGAAVQEETDKLRVYLEEAKATLIDEIVAQEKDSAIQQKALALALEVLREAVSTQIRQYGELPFDMEEKEKAAAQARITEEARAKLVNIVPMSLEKARLEK